MSDEITEDDLDAFLKNGEEMRPNVDFTQTCLALSQGENLNPFEFLASMISIIDYTVRELQPKTTVDVGHFVGEVLQNVLRQTDSGEITLKPFDKRVVH